MNPFTPLPLLAFVILSVSFFICGVLLGGHYEAQRAALSASATAAAPAAPAAPTPATIVAEYDFSVPAHSAWGAKAREVRLPTGERVLMVASVGGHFAAVLLPATAAALVERGP